MSGDTYQRAIRYVNDRWTPSVDGTHKVVPADAIVIERGDLPEVFADRSVVAGPVAVATDADPDLLWRMVLGHLAVVEYLRTHPPVDEAEVERLADVLCADAGHEHQGRPECSAWIQARRIYLAGVRAPEVTE